MSKYKFKTGVFLARMQPLHIAHLYLIEQALKECERVYVVLGSANKKDMLRNPFSLSIRRSLLEESLDELGYSKEDIGRISIFELPDWSYENDTNETITWGRYLYYNVVSRAQTKKFAIYYSDNSEIIKSWFNSEVREYITLRLFDRSSVYEGLSATKIRTALINKDMEYLQKYCPPPVLRNLDLISTHYNAVAVNPKADFAME